jgi:hypothetical protein
MTREGSALFGGLLYDLHADGCDGEERSTCQPVVVPEPQPSEQTHRIEVVMMAWCPECHAAEWEVV